MAMQGTFDISVCWNIQFGVWPKDGPKIVILDRKHDWREYLEGLDHEPGCKKLGSQKIDKCGDAVMCADDNILSYTEQ